MVRTGDAISLEIMAKRDVSPRVTIQGAENGDSGPVDAPWGGR